MQQAAIKRRKASIIRRRGKQVKPAKTKRVLVGKGGK